MQHASFEADITRLVACHSAGGREEREKMTARSSPGEGGKLIEECERVVMLVFSY